jgi:hypothetical protein
MMGGGGETGQGYASRSRPGGLGGAKHLSPLLLHTLIEPLPLFIELRGS